MSPARRNTLFSFAPVTEDQLRRARLNSFWWSAVVALAPYLFAVMLHLSDAQGLNVFVVGIPDIALASVVLAIAAYSNTILSFAKLKGWERPSGLTTFVAVAVGLLTIMSLAQYLKAAYTSEHEHVLSILFYTTLL